jgi:hypothetical protein
VRSLCTVELNVSDNNTEVLGVAQLRFLWRIYVAGNNKTYSGLHEKCPIFLSDFNYVGESKIIRNVGTCFAGGYTTGWA